MEVELAEIQDFGIEQSQKVMLSIWRQLNFPLGLFPFAFVTMYLMKSSATSVISKSHMIVLTDVESV